MNYHQTPDTRDTRHLKCDIVELISQDLFNSAVVHCKICFDKRSSGFAKKEGAAPRPLIVDWQIHDIFDYGTYDQLPDSIYLRGGQSWRKFPTPFHGGARRLGNLRHNEELAG